MTDHKIIMEQKVALSTICSHFLIISVYAVMGMYIYIDKYIPKGSWEAIFRVADDF